MKMILIRNNNRNLFYLAKIFILACTIISFSLVIIFIKNNYLIIVLLYILGIMSMIIVDLDLMHPYVWFIPIFLLYSTVSAISILTGNNEIIGTFKLYDTLFLSWIALVTFIIIIGPQKYSIKSAKIEFSNSIFFVNTVHILSVIGIFLMCLYIIQSGSTNKRDISLDNSIFITIGFYGIQFFVFSFLIIIIHSLNIKNKMNKSFIAFSILTSLMVIFIAGERDFLIRLFILFVIIYNEFIKKISKFKLLIFGLGGLLSLNILQNLKNIFIRQAELNAQHSSLLNSLLSGEFVSAGRNLQILIQNNMGSIFSNSNTLITDIKFAIMNLPFFNTNLETPTSWFNNTFYKEYLMKGGGKGFTLIGEGYINYGLTGVIIWFIILGLVVKFFYKKAVNSSMWFVVYLLMISNTIYCLRADLGIYLSFILKYVMLPVFCMKIFNFIRNKKVHIIMQSKVLCKRE